jgi:hypothetical protein
MLDKLLDLVKQFSGDAIVNNPEIPNERNNEAVADATHSIFSGLQNAVAGGGGENVLQLLGGKAGDLMKNPIVQMIAGTFVKKLLSKFNMSPAAANNVASGLIPNVLGNLVNQTNDPNNSNFDLQGILGSLTGGGGNAGGGNGGGGFDLQGILGKLTGGGGLDANNDGQTNLQDVLSMFTNGAQSQIQQQNTQGGITGLLKNLLG